MKNKSINFTILLILILLLSTCTFSPSFPIAKELVYNPPEPETFVLDNGIKVYYMEDRELPLIYGTLFIPGGSLNWGEFKPGVLEALGVQMRLGGAGKYSATELDLKLKELSAGVSSSVSNENSTFGFSTLSQDLDTVLDLFELVISQPIFEEGRLELWKRQALEAIDKRKDDPSAIARVALRTLVYGTDNVFGRLLSKKDLEKIQRIDLLKAHRKIIRPTDALLALKGNLPQSAIEKKLNTRLGRWQLEKVRSEQSQALKVSLPPIPKFSYRPQADIYFVEKDVQQSTVYIAQPGPKRLTDDYAAIDVFNTVFGSSGFNSLLVQELREKRGLVYSAYGAIDPDVEVGLNIIAFQTKMESTLEALLESLKTLESMQQSNFKTDKIQDAKDSIKNSFVFRYDNSYELAKRKAVKELLKYPSDYDETYLPKIAEVLADDLVKVANKYWDTQKLVIIVVGPRPVLQALKTSKKAGTKFFEDKEIVELGFEEGQIKYLK